MTAAALALIPVLERLAAVFIPIGAAAGTIIALLTQTDAISALLGGVAGGVTPPAVYLAGYVVQLFVASITQ